MIICQCITWTMSTQYVDNYLRYGRHGKWISLSIILCADIASLLFCKCFLSLWLLIHYNITLKTNWMINSCSKYQGDWDTFRFLANLFPELSSTRLQIRERSQFYIQNKRKVLFQTPIKAIIQHIHLTMNSIIIHWYRCFAADS